MIRLSPDLSLPLDVVGESTAILAKKGAGKSNTAKVIVEGALDAGVQVVVLDPVGHWWGLRSLQPVPVIGGMVGDVPLDPHAGKLLADVAVESGQSLVLDVSGLDSDGAMQRFAYEFAETLYKLKQAHPTPLLLVLEEADEFAPQNTQGANVPRMVGAFNRIVKRGRGRGLGVLAVTQRSAALNKNVLDQSDTLIVMRTIGPRDRDAIAGWVKFQDAQGIDDVIPSLPKLQTGEAWVWTPERALLQRVQVDKARSLDTSETPITVAGGVAQRPKTLKPIDLDALGAQIEATVERVKANDPESLKKRVRELERDLAQRPAEVVTETLTETVEVQVPVLSDGDRALLARVLETSDVAIDDLRRQLARIADVLEKGTDRAPEPPRPAASAPRAAPAPRAAERPARAPRSAAPSDQRVSGPQQKILDALAWFEAIGVTDPRRPPLAAVAGVSSKSSGFRANVSTLSGLGLISYPDGGRIGLTDPGRGQAQPPEIAPTEEALHDAIYRMVSGPQAALLRELIRAYPDSLDREELASRAGVSHLSSGFRANVSTLSGFELIGYPTGGQVAALPILFPERAYA